MAQFNINLPGNIPADVRQGKVMNKIAGLSKHWPWIKLKTIRKTGYIVTIDDTNGADKKQYHLIKTIEGNWPAGDNHELRLAIKKEGRWLAIQEDNNTRDIKKQLMTMKTSNKIILGILLTGFGYLACAQIALHIKYANRDSMDPHKYHTYFFDRYQFDDINNVRLDGLAECELILSDSVQLSVEKSNFNYVKFKKMNDTLIITGEYPVDRLAGYKLNRSSQNVKLYVPTSIPIAAVNSNIKVKGTRKTGNEQSYQFDLTGCNLFTRYNFGVDSLERYFDTLSVHARKNSQVILFYNDHFKLLDVKLDQSLINDYHAKVEKAAITGDSSSVIVLSGKNIRKLNPVLITQ